jgi:hypothetical protein
MRAETKAKLDVEKVRRSLGVDFLPQGINFVE